MDQTTNVVAGQGEPAQQRPVRPTPEPSESTDQPAAATGPKLSRRALGVAAGAALGVGLLGTPLTHLAAQVGADLTPGPSPVPAKTRRSRRLRSYDLAVPWLKDAQALPLVQSYAPAGHVTLFTMGSSEFATPVPQNPATFLFQQSSDFDLRYAGKAFCQSLFHAIQLAAMADQLQHRKAAFIVSAQWFLGAQPKLFASMFSNSLFQRAMDTSAISDATKQAIAGRTAQLVDDPVWFSDSSVEPLRTPYDAAVRQARVLREESAGLKSVALRSAPWEIRPGSRPARTIDWQGAHKKAAAQAKKQLTSNPYNIGDRYYATRLAKVIKGRRNSQADRDYSRDSAEWQDLELVLRVAAEANIELLVLATPMNGKWYDYLGYDAARRAQWANRLAQVCHRPQVQYREWFDREHEPGFMYDPAHPGWNGWLAFSQALVDFAAPQV